MAKKLPRYTVTLTVVDPIVEDPVNAADIRQIIAYALEAEDLVARKITVKKEAA